MIAFLIVLALIGILVAASLIMRRKRRRGRVLIAQPRSGGPRSGNAGS